MLYQLSYTPGLVDRMGFKPISLHKQYTNQCIGLAFAFFVLPTQTWCACGDSNPDTQWIRVLKTRAATNYATGTEAN